MAGKREPLLRVSPSAYAHGCSRSGRIVRAEAERLRPGRFGIENHFDVARRRFPVEAASVRVLQTRREETVLSVPQHPNGFQTLQLYEIATMLLSGSFCACEPVAPLRLIRLALKCSTSRSVGLNAGPVCGGRACHQVCWNCVPGAEVHLVRCLCACFCILASVRSLAIHAATWPLDYSTPRP